PSPVTEEPSPVIRRSSRVREATRSWREGPEKSKQPAEASVTAPPVPAPKSFPTLSASAPKRPPAWAPVARKVLPVAAFVAVVAALTAGVGGAGFQGYRLVLRDDAEARAAVSESLAAGKMDEAQRRLDGAHLGSGPRDGVE